MPLLSAADEVMFNNVRAHRIYRGNTLVWPPVIETWSAWQEILSVAGTPNTAWYGTCESYDTGAHERGKWRYSNLGRVHYRGIIRATAVMNPGAAVVGNYITDPAVPKPTSILRMADGPGSLAYSSVYGGGYVRFDAGTYAYHHLVTVATQTAQAIPTGNWFAMDAIFAFAADA